jgi:hypothetical protein
MRKGGKSGLAEHKGVFRNGNKLSCRKTERKYVLEDVEVGGG